MSTHEEKPNSGVEAANDTTLPVTLTVGVDEAKLLRKIDVKLLPILFIIYFAAFLDRVNISNVFTMGLQRDIKLAGNQANIALSVFFIPYVLFEIPSNVLLKRFSPRVWLSGCTMAFGVSMLAQGFVRSYGGILTTRFFLGLAETGMFPGSFYLISFWYKPHESQKRFTFFWTSVMFAGACGGFLASAIAKMDGIAGLQNWRWIFILEGLGTVTLGVVSYFFIVDFPESASWLSEKERAFILERTARCNSKEAHASITATDVVLFFKSPRLILGAMMYFGVIVPIYSFSYFAPTIIKTFGYSAAQTQLYTVVPFSCALVLCLAIAYASDLTRVRMCFVVFGLGLGVIGLAILMNIHDYFAVQLAALCLVAMGSFSAGISIICWYLMNLHGHVEKSLGSAWMISFGNTGGVVATFSFLASDAPQYTKGYAICLGSIGVSAVSTIVYAALVYREMRINRHGPSEFYSL